MECSVWETVASRLKKSMCKVFLGSAEEEMPISHKIRQYKAILGFALQGKVLLSAERGEEVAPKQRIWRACGVWGLTREHVHVLVPEHRMSPNAILCVFMEAPSCRQE